MNIDYTSYVFVHKMSALVNEVRMLSWKYHNWEHLLQPM